MARAWGPVRVAIAAGGPWAKVLDPLYTAMGSGFTTRAATNSTRSSPSRWRTPVCPRSWPKAATSDAYGNALRKAATPGWTRRARTSVRRRSMSMVWRSSGGVLKIPRGEPASSGMRLGYLQRPHFLNQADPPSRLSSTSADGEFGAGTAGFFVAEFTLSAGARAGARQCVGLCRACAST